jgi:hypothetical protein
LRESGFQGTDLVPKSTVLLPLEPDGNGGRGDRGDDNGFGFGPGHNFKGSSEKFAEKTSGGDVRRHRRRSHPSRERGRGRLDGKRQQHTPECHRWEGHVARTEEIAQCVEGAAHAFTCRLFAQPEGGSDLAKGLALQVVKHDRISIRFTKGGETFIEQWPDTVPCGIQVVRGRVHIGGEAFPFGAASVLAQQTRGFPAHREDEPTGHHDFL